MMLDQERAVEAERLGLDIVVDEVAEPLAAVHVRTATLSLGTAKQSEPHCDLPHWGLK